MGITLGVCTWVKFGPVHDKKRKEMTNPMPASLAYLQGERDTKTLASISSEALPIALPITGKPNNDRGLAPILLYSPIQAITSTSSTYPPRNN